MSGSSSPRYQGKALLKKYNGQLIFSIAALGFCLAGLIGAAAAAIFYPSFILLIISFAFLLWRIVLFGKKASEKKIVLQEQLYNTDDKQYLFKIEGERDILTARLIQEGLCPWRATTCKYKGATCLCTVRAQQLKLLDLDVHQEKKIVLYGDKTDDKST